MTTFTNWSDRFGDCVSRRVEKATGVIVLVYVAETDEAVLREWFKAGMRASDAANRYLNTGEGMIGEGPMRRAERLS
jgi:hypothetical protein